MIVVLLMVFPLLVSLAHAAATPAAQAASTRVVIVAVDKLAMEDFADHSDALQELTARIPDGAIGMMNVRTAAAANSANGYLSLATGRRAAAGSQAGLALMVDETHLGQPAGRFYQGLTGRAPRGPIVHLGLGELIQSALPPQSGAGASPSPAAPTSLGAILTQEGRSAALFGNSDALGERRRHAAVLAMDHDGVILAGEVGPGVLVRDDDFPGGTRTDFDALARQLDQVPDDTVDLVVVDVGDLARLEAAESILPPGRAEALRKESLRRIASFIASLLDGAAAQTREPGNLNGFGPAASAPGRRVIYVISPSPSTTAGRGGILLTPVLRWELTPGGPGGPASASGVLTSPTTRREGLVTNTDFLPSVLVDLGLEPPSSLGGRPWEAKPRSDALGTLLEHYMRIKHVHRQRLPVIQPYFLTLLFFFFLGALMIVLMRLGAVRDLGRFSTWWRFLTTVLLAGPAALLLLALLSPRPLAHTWALFAGLSLALALTVTAASRWRPGRRHDRRSPGNPENDRSRPNPGDSPRRASAPAGLLGALTTALLVVDVALGAPLMQRSLLGYDPVAGSRYYGIGNEYMGVLLGAALIGCALALDALPRHRPLVRWLPAAVFGAITTLMIHPNLGINVGGAISAAATGVIATLLVLRRPLTFKAALAWSGGIALLVGGAAILDTLLSGERASHLGQVVQSVSDGGVDPLWTLFGRKVAVNLRLIRLTVWSRVVFAAFAFLVSAVYVPSGFQRELSRRFPGLVEMTKAGVIGALVALAVNDSGVVAASTLLLWPVLAVLSLVPEAARRDDAGPPPHNLP